jgi:hypothetical protein
MERGVQPGRATGYDHDVKEAIEHDAGERDQAVLWLDEHEVYFRHLHDRRSARAPFTPDAYTFGNSLIAFADTLFDQGITSIAYANGCWLAEGLQFNGAAPLAPAVATAWDPRQVSLESTWQGAPPRGFKITAPGAIALPPSYYNNTSRQSRTL